MGKYRYTGTGVDPHPCPICEEVTRLPGICIWCWAKRKELSDEE